MGTMVGEDAGAVNQIGVAPAAKWIAAKGCETNSCSDAALLASGQWILAPTDLAGQNPRPDLRPHIVNNSWGGGGGDPWYQATVECLDRRRASSPPSRTGTPARAAASSGSPGDYTQQLQRRRLRHQQRHCRLLEPRGVGLRRRAEAEHRCSGSQRPQQRADELVRSVQRHVDGLAARGRHRRAHLVGAAGPTGEHRCDRGTTRLHCGRHVGPDLRRHGRRQQRLGRGQARRLRGRRRRASASSATAATSATTATTATTASASATATAPPPPPPPPPPPAPPPARCRVPNVIGLRLATARARILARRCRVGTVRRVRSRRVGRVLGQSPRGGAVRARQLQGQPA